MELTNENALQFILAGKAQFTVTNISTQNRYTYKVNRCDTNNNLYFVSVLYNYKSTNKEYSDEQQFKYIGTIRKDTNTEQIQFIYGNKSILKQDSIQVKGFTYIIKHLITKDLPDVYFITHTGKCGRCGRRLTDEKSILTGLGSECRKIIGL